MLRGNFIIPKESDRRIGNEGILFESSKTLFSDTGFDFVHLVCDLFSHTLLGDEFPKPQRRNISGLGEIPELHQYFKNARFLGSA